MPPNNAPAGMIGRYEAGGQRRDNDDDNGDNNGSSPEPSTTTSPLKSFNGLQVAGRIAPVADDSDINAWNSKGHPCRGRIINVLMAIYDLMRLIYGFGFILSFFIGYDKVFWADDKKLYFICSLAAAAYALIITIMIGFLERQVVVGDRTTKEKTQEWPTPAIQLLNAIMNLLLYCAAMVVFSYLWSLDGPSSCQMKAFEQFGLALYAAPAVSILTEFSRFTAKKVFLV